MRVDSTTNSYTNIFQARTSQNQGDEPFSLDSETRKGGSGLQPMSTPPSISSSLWSLQSSDDTTIAEETEADQEAKARHDELTSELSKYANMTPAEMMRAQYLEAHHMTEEDLQQMPADQRAAIEKDIADSIKRSLSNKDSTSAIGDVPQMAGASGGNSAGADGKPA